MAGSRRNVDYDKGRAASRAPRHLARFAVVGVLILGIGMPRALAASSQSTAGQSSSGLPWSTPWPWFPTSTRATPTPAPTTPSYPPRNPSHPAPGFAATSGGLTTQDLTQGVTPAQLAATLVGSGVTVSNVTYSGAPVAAATFGGGTGIIGFDSGIILSTGCAHGVVGPNNSASYTCANGTPGDPELTTLAGRQTYDASILQFDFVPNQSTVFFQYVFGSEEYNEYVGSQYNDVFAFDVNGKNCALVGNPPQPVTINTINLTKNANLYLNNDPFNTPSGYPVPNPLLNTQLDGLTRVLTCQATVTPNAVNHIRLAIADASDEYYDSDVFLQAGSFSTTPPPALTATLKADSATTIPGGTDGYTITVANSGQASAIVTALTLTLPSGFHYLSGTSSIAGATIANPVVNGATLTWTGPFNVPAGGQVSLHLRVGAPTTPGSYQAQAGGTAGGTTITGTSLTVTITVGGSSHAVLMAGSYHGTYTVALAGCPPLCSITGTGSGASVGLLSSTVSFQEIANYSGSPGYQCGTLTGTMTFVANADKSQLTATYQGSSCFASGNSSVHYESGTLHITGGTGRFATAGGSTTFSGSRSCLPATCSINDPYHVFSYIFSGNVTAAS